MNAPRDLAAAGVVSKQDLDQAKATMDLRRPRWMRWTRRCGNSRCSLHYYKVVALQGLVSLEMFRSRRRDRVTTSTPLTTIDQPGSLEAYVYVPIEHSSQLKMNLPVQLIDAKEKVLANSRISFISPQVDNTTANGAGESRNHEW